MAIKANMDAAGARSFLSNYYQCDMTAVQPIEQGELSRAYYFQHRGLDYVIRFNNKGEGFAKEQWLCGRFPSLRSSIPSIVDTGLYGELSYCISIRASGQSLQSMQLSQIRYVIPDLLNQFAQFQQLSLPEHGGYGMINSEGNGMCGSWSEFLELFFDETGSGFWYGWKQLFKAGILEQDYFEAWYSRMAELAEFVPEERYLVHGDFHVGNIISDGKRITGIVDWEMGMYGDFVFDIATMEMWTPELQFSHLFREYTHEMGCRIDSFEERFQCATLFKSLDALRFYAKKKDRGAYEHIKRFIDKMAAG
ncbi:aminoglycoside phosphotransferase family protein [Paenibacillus frigoriresistens]|uniref:aminoglycoside phosphotransferase family protein n=1 Tax=Paenibacillus alginolyticus TaxID=59839 RepID=UPI0015639919|nr:aminoglycoside phosphotransferase family protein [Paenibacillus frigoriresistens]NRF95366.1 aminoglycoside phosphotransferase family protein [Paenibacillus frigoriresistens]